MAVKQRRSAGKNVIFFILFILLMASWVSASTNQEARDYSYLEFENALYYGNVDMVVIDQSREVPTGDITVYLTGETKQKILSVSDVNAIQELLQSENVYYEVNPIVDTDWMWYVSALIMGALLGAMFIFVSLNKQAGGNKMADFGKSKAKKASDKDEKVTFANVAGLREEKESLEEVVHFLTDPYKYIQVGARIPKGILLVGPPGTGKTLLAKAVAGEADVPFFSISGSDFVEMFVGVGASRVRDLFAEAKKSTPCIIFIDEIDAVARRRGSGMGGGHDEREQTLNQMLVEMDGFGVNQGVIVMAATNRVDILDPAILRPGRFDRQIMVGRPDVAGRREILEVHAKNKSFGEDVNLDEVARTTAGFAGADLENLLNESAIIAARKERKFLMQDDINTAFIKVGIGTEKRSAVVPEEERRITAYHEAGHAILFHKLPDVGPVHTVSIIPTGNGAAGYVMPLPENDHVFNTKKKLLQDIVVSLGGRIAEDMIFDDITTGASQDIKVATKKALAMVTRFGMSDKIGMISYHEEQDDLYPGSNNGSKNYSPETAKIIDDEVKKIIDQCYQEASDILQANIQVLHDCANLLLEKEKINREEFEALF